MAWVDSTGMRSDTARTANTVHTHTAAWHAHQKELRRKKTWRKTSNAGARARWPAGGYCGCVK